MIPTVPADQHATRFFNALDKAEAEARADASIGPVIAADAGAWSVHHTGGGCLTWAMPTDDGGAELWICDEGNGLGVGAEFWLIGLHPHEGWQDHFQAEAKTLQEALALAHAANAARQFALFFSPDAPMTFREFVASGRDVADISAECDFDDQAEGPGRIYAECVFMERDEAGELYLTIGNMQYVGRAQPALERILYTYASQEGHLAPDAETCRKDAEEAERPLWQTEFGDYPVGDMPAIPAGWEDTSWHNDVCPSFKAPGNLQIFVDFADVEQREMQEGERFSVNAMDVDGVHITGDCNVFASDDWQAVLDFVGSYVTPFPDADAIARLTEYAERSGGAKIEAELSAELEAYCKAEGLPLMSADELLAELQAKEGGASPHHSSYLSAFIARWEAVARVTDEENRAEAESPAPVEDEHSEYVASLVNTLAKLQAPAPMSPADELAAVKAELAAQYVKRIGYDPFEDCPTISAAEVARTLIEHADENGKAALDCVAEALTAARRNAFPG